MGVERAAVGRRAGQGDRMTILSPIAEGNYIRHTTDGFVGVHAGFTRLAHLMERPGDLRAVRVELPGGEIRIAGERSLEQVAPAVFGRYAVKTGVKLAGRQAKETKGPEAGSGGPRPATAPLPIRTK